MMRRLVLSCALLVFCQSGFVISPLSAAPVSAELERQADAADQACVSGATQQERYLRSHQEAVRGQADTSPVWTDFSQRLTQYRAFVAACVTQLRGFHSQLAGQPGQGERTGRLYRHIFDFGPGDRDRADDWQAILDHKH